MDVEFYRLSLCGLKRHTYVAHRNTGRLLAPAVGVFSAVGAGADDQ
jgi:hypothetical protein